MGTTTPLSNWNAEHHREDNEETVDSLTDECRCIRFHFQGVVQGVGFRPFIYRVANELHLTGSVWNSSEGVFAEVQGAASTLDRFTERVSLESPPQSHIQSIRTEFIPLKSVSQFRIDPSDEGEKTTLIPPDLGTCPDCLSEILDPNNPRYRYPFTNCTHCGPRYSILQNLPYDRCNTSMSLFTMCEECATEYHDPTDRRFHAQPNACPKCGPKLAFWDEEGLVLAYREEALFAAERVIRAGQVLAVKGLGGFHLMVDARNEDAVKKLRSRKHREEKPLAIMFPNLEEVRKVCLVDDLGKDLLTSSEAPIVLLEKRHPDNSPCNHLSRQIAPHNTDLGVMLPYTPLHHLLLTDLGFPVVATSGNLSDEPICIDEMEAVSRLQGIADFFLVHDRPIVRQVDDSIVRIIAGREMMLRRSRGYAPLPVSIKHSVSPTLAVGAHFKNTIAAAMGERVYLSQHIGDLETMVSFQAFEKTVRTFEQLKDFRPDTVVHDLHPDYLSSSFARSSKMRCVGIQHHHAHVLSCMADQGVEPPLLGLAWDGTGLGTDGTIWGGEFLRIDEQGNFERVAHLRTFPLPGGDAAAREPSRSALGLLCSSEEIPQSQWMNLFLVKSFGERGLRVLKQMVTNRVNSPLTSSMGRLFDAVAAIVGQRFVSRFEGQAAMDLEFLIGKAVTDEFYPISIVKKEEEEGWILDWSPMICAILDEVQEGRPAPEISIRFHNTLAEMAVGIAKKVAERQVLLSGGCFQNRYLSERVIKRLREEGFEPFWHQQVPPNDGGIALGQILAAISEGRRQPCV